MANGWKAFVGPSHRRALARLGTPLRALGERGKLFFALEPKRFVGTPSRALRERLGEARETLYLGSASVKAHRHSAGARGRGQEAIGR